MRKLLSVAILAVIIFSNLVFVSNVNASTPANGILTSNTTWTSAQSPIQLTGPVSVNTGVTLTIDPGVTVDLAGFYLQVNGTLIAKGTNDNKIVFTSSVPQSSNPFLRQQRIVFTSVGNGWNEQTGSGSIVQNAVLPDLVSTSSSVKITKCSITEIDVDGGSSIISDNSIIKITVNDGSPTITNNDITGGSAPPSISADTGFTILKGAPTIASNTIHIRPWVRGGSSTFTNNKLFEGIHADSSGGQVAITNNEVSSSNYPIILLNGPIHAVISKNKINGINNNPVGIAVSGDETAAITENQIYNCQTGIDVAGSDVQISKNVIFNNNLGINLVVNARMPSWTSAYATNQTVDIHENTLDRNLIGIQYTPHLSTATITNNNIQDNSQYNFKLQCSNNVTIANNWWGTTDQSAISNSIFDNKNDFNLGKVTFTPILSSPNTDAPSIPTDNSNVTPNPITTITPTKSPSLTPITQPTQNPTATSSQPVTGIHFDLSNVEVAILAVLIVITVLLAVLILVVLRKRR